MERLSAILKTKQNNIQVSFSQDDIVGVTIAGSKGLYLELKGGVRHKIEDYFHFRRLYHEKNSIEKIERYLSKSALFFHHLAYKEKSTLQDKQSLSYDYSSYYKDYVSHITKVAITSSKGITLTLDDGTIYTIDNYFRYRKNPVFQPVIEKIDSYLSLEALKRRRLVYNNEQGVQIVTKHFPYLEEYASHIKKVVISTPKDISLTFGDGRHETIRNYLEYRKSLAFKPMIDKIDAYLSSDALALNRLMYKGEAVKVNITRNLVNLLQTNIKEKLALDTVDKNIMTKKMLNVLTGTMAFTVLLSAASLVKKRTLDRYYDGVSQKVLSDVVMYQPMAPLSSKDNKSKIIFEEEFSPLISNRLEHFSLASSQKNMITITPQPKSTILDTLPEKSAINQSSYQSLRAAYQDTIDLSQETYGMLATIKLYSTIFGLEEEKLEQAIREDTDTMINAVSNEVGIIQVAAKQYLATNSLDYPVDKSAHQLTREEINELIIMYGKIFNLTNEEIAYAVAIPYTENPRIETNNIGGQSHLKDDVMIADIYQNIDIGVIQHIRSVCKNLELAKTVAEYFPHASSGHTYLYYMNTSYCPGNAPIDLVYKTDEEGKPYARYEVIPTPSFEGGFWYQCVEEHLAHVYLDYPELLPEGGLEELYTKFPALKPYMDYLQQNNQATTEMKNVAKEKSEYVYVR